MVPLLFAAVLLTARRWYLRGLGGINLLAGALTCWGVAHNEWLPWGALLLMPALLLSAATLKLLTHEPAS